MKAQGMLLTILTLTQITELKVLFDVGRTGHSFYDLILILILSSIAIEVLVGIIIIYIGNMEYRHSVAKIMWNYDVHTRLRYSDLKNSTKTPTGKGGNTGATSVHSLRKQRSYESLGQDPPKRGEVGEFITHCCCCEPQPGHGYGSVSGDIHQPEIQLESIKTTQEQQTRTTRTTTHVRIMEKSFSTHPAKAKLLEEREQSFGIEELASASTDMGLQELETEQHIAVAHQQQEQELWLRLRTVFYWQQRVTYLLHIVLLMNAFITVFGISGGNQRLFTAKPHHVNTHLLSGRPPHMTLPMPS